MVFLWFSYGFPMVSNETQNSPKYPTPQPRSTALEQQRLAEKPSCGSCSKQGLCIGEVQHKTCVAQRGEAGGKMWKTMASG